MRSFFNQSIRRMFNGKSSSSVNLPFVPEQESWAHSELDELRSFITKSNHLLVLSGAGISTESGIPDYRSENVGLFARSNYRPVQFQNFMTSESARRRYWARNYVGWNQFSSREPNTAHRYLKQLEEEGKVRLVVTQNVDRLHHKAGSQNVLELHGTAYEVICMQCGRTTCRHALQSGIAAHNKPIRIEMSQIKMRPDGDFDLPSELIEQFQTPYCEICNGILKPDIVFFGDNVPRLRVERVSRELLQSDGLLVFGSSLQVYSGFRFLIEAHELGKPIFIVNIGKTRADHLATLKVSGRCGSICEQLLETT